jgi:hypothetical protein
MSDQDTGSKDRATVALVSEKVDGLKELTRAGFTDIQRQLDRVAELPTIVTGHTEKLKEYGRRLDDLEETDDKKRDYRSTVVPSLIIGAGGLLVAIITLVVTSAH